MPVRHPPHRRQQTQNTEGAAATHQRRSRRTILRRTRPQATTPPSRKPTTHPMQRVSLVSGDVALRRSASRCSRSGGAAWRLTRHTRRWHYTQPGSSAARWRSAIVSWWRRCCNGIYAVTRVPLCKDFAEWSAVQRHDEGSNFNQRKAHPLVEDGGGE